MRRQKNTKVHQTQKDDQQLHLTMNRIPQGWQEHWER
jgi:hypothetical protein